MIVYYHTYIHRFYANIFLFQISQNQSSNHFLQKMVLGYWYSPLTISFKKRSSQSRINFVFLKGFLNVLLQLKEIAELDIAILYETLLCCKAVMNSASGMDAFLSDRDAVEVIARCLQFDYKVLTLLVLEILSVCCYYSQGSARCVLAGIKVSARDNF